MEWELCKTRFKDTHFHEGKFYNILNYERPKEGAYLILESFTNTPHKTIHVISIPSEDLIGEPKPFSFAVGRDSEVSIRITDISVSREHSIITYYQGNFYLSDCNSKFGTVLLLQSPVEISYTNRWAYSFQLGRWMIQLQPQQLPMEFWECPRYEELQIFPDKVYTEYINYYPYLLSMSLGVINKDSIK